MIVNLMNRTEEISVKDVAAYFVKLDDARDVEDGITNLKLQKLVYSAQGYPLAYFGKALFGDRIDAWQYGPVAPSLYEGLRTFGRNPVDIMMLTDNPDGLQDKFSEEARSLLDSIFEQLGQFSAWKLMEMTHEEDPWKNTQMSKEISHEKLQKYFSTQISQ